MVSGWFLFGVGELSEMKESPDFWAISSNRIVLATGNARAVQNRNRLASSPFMIYCQPVYQSVLLCSCLSSLIGRLGLGCL